MHIGHKYRSQSFRVIFIFFLPITNVKVTYYFDSTCLDILLLVTAFSELTSQSRIKNQDLTIKGEMIFYDLDNCSCTDWCFCIYPKQNQWDWKMYLIIRLSIRLFLVYQTVLSKILFFLKLLFMILFPRYHVLSLKVSYEIQHYLLLDLNIANCEINPNANLDIFSFYFKKDLWHFFRYADDKNVFEDPKWGLMNRS